MDKDAKIVVTGAAGFIAANLAKNLNSQGFEHLILVDDFGDESKLPNLRNVKFDRKIHRDQFIDRLKANKDEVQYVFHLGARTDTTEMNYEVHRVLNLEYSKHVWEACAQHHIPLVYASSAATYGDGAHGYKDSHELPELLQPLNPYGVSKNEFDIWALQQKKQPPFWAGVKFFNVYGPGEDHKGRMASVMWHAWRQMQETGSITLFRSHRKDFKDGEQLRDFIYVDDIVAILLWLMEQQPDSGLYNAGTGTARTFLALAKAMFAAAELDEDIRFRDTPEDIRDKYQYFTEADMSKLRNAGFDAPFKSLEEGIKQYVETHLKMH